MKRLITISFLFGVIWFGCERNYGERYLYIAVAGDYGILFQGTYGDYHDQYKVTSKTPDYYYFKLREFNNSFSGTFKKIAFSKTDFRCLTIRLYLKEFAHPASLIVETSQTHPESALVVHYAD